jgi:hypothetical protein
VGDRVDADEPRPIPPDPAYTARALAHHRAVLSRAARPIAPAATVAVLPRPDGPTWATARAIARHRAASFNAFEPIAPAVASARRAPARPDGPTWAAALVAGALAVAVAAGLGLMAGRRTVRVRSG